MNPGQFKCMPSNNLGFHSMLVHDRSLTIISSVYLFSSTKQNEDHFTEPGSAPRSGLGVSGTKTKKK